MNICFDPLIPEMPAVVSKRGVDDGNQKVGALPSRLKKASDIITLFSRFLRRAEGEGSKQKVLDLFNLL